MITKEERAEVRDAIYDHRNTLYQTVAGYWLRQYEDTVRELGGQLESARKILIKVADISSVDGAGKSLSQVNMVVNEYLNPLSQLEKGDKDNANK